MLRFILGTSGTGKTAAVYDRISELLGTEGARALVLVPDQSTFETEKALLGLLGAKRALRAEVYGFSSLCRRVSELTADVAHNVLDNGTRAVIMSLALEQLTDKLSLFAQCNLGFSYLNYTQEKDKDYKQSSIGLSLSLFPGLVYKLTEKFYVEAKLPWPKMQFSIRNDKTEDGNIASYGGKRSIERTQTNFAFAPSSSLGSIMDNTSIGISYHF